MDDKTHESQTASYDLAPKQVEQGGYDNNALTELNTLIEEGRKSKWAGDTKKKAEILFEYVLRWETDLEMVVLLAADLHISIFEKVVQVQWPERKVEDKETIVRELLKSTTEQGITKQIAIAEKIAPNDPTLSLQLLLGAVGSNSHDCTAPKIQKFKLEILQKRFLASAFIWESFDGIAPEVMKPILAALVEAADDPKIIQNQKSKTSLGDFARWAGAVVNSLSHDDPFRQQVLERLEGLGKRKPDSEKPMAQVETHGRPTPIPQVEQEQERPSSPTNNSSPQTSVKAIDVSAGISLLAEKPGNDVGLAETTSDGPQSVSVLSFDPSAGISTTSLEDVNSLSLDSFLQQKRLEAEQRRIAIDSLLNGMRTVETDLEFLKRVYCELGDLKKEKAALDERVRAGEDQLRLAHDQAAGLMNANIKLEQELVQARQTNATAQSEIDTLRGNLEEFHLQSATEKEARAKEQRRFAAQIEREKQYELNGFKGKLKGALIPIFDNKRTTDSHPVSPELANALRRWFKEVEDKLATSGIQLG